MYVAGPPIRALHDKRLKTGESNVCRFKEPRLGKLEVAGIGDVVQAVAYMEMDDGRPQDVTCIVKRKPHIGRNIAHLLLVKGNGMCDELLDFLESVRARLTLPLGYFHKVLLKKHTQVASGWSAVDGTVVE